MILIIVYISIILYFLKCGARAGSLANTSTNMDSFAGLSCNDIVPQDALFQVFNDVKQYYQKQTEKLRHVDENNVIKQTETFEQNTNLLSFNTTSEKTFDDMENFSENTFDNMTSQNEMQEQLFTPIAPSTKPQHFDPHYSIVQNLFNIWVTHKDIKHKEHKKTLAHT